MHVYVWVYELITVLNLKLGSSKFSVFTSSDLQIFSKAISKSLGIGYVHAIYTQTHIWIYTYICTIYMDACTVNKIRTQSACRHRRAYIYVRTWLLKLIAVQVSVFE